MIREEIRKLAAYVPGEQPKGERLLKLNTNENPYPPAPGVARAIRAEIGACLRLYPDPVSARFRERVGKALGFACDQVIAGNGSDDLLMMCLRAFAGEGDLVQFPWPSYSLYPVLAHIQSARVRRVPFGARYELRVDAFDPRAALTFVANPNAPSGTSVSAAFLRRLARRLKGVLVVDEAYADFARENALALARSEPNVLVSRSLSKSFSLAGMRLGFAMGSRDLVAALFKVKDSYNLDRLAQAAGEAAFADLAWHRRCTRRIVRTRERFRAALERRGWDVLPSEANFVFVRPPSGDAEGWFSALRKRGILVRWFSSEETRERLRITVGTDAEMRTVLRAVDAVAGGD
ncbi:MAG: histidinol-phosphate transaminase [Verrucomicrobiae bacterium]|nr:histidinol-phosphate transaminase [Verrucomicrobiae bacterium]